VDSSLRSIRNYTRLEGVSREMQGITVKLRGLAPLIIKALLFAVPLVLAACQHNGSGGSGY